MRDEWKMRKWAGNRDFTRAFNLGSTDAPTKGSMHRNQGIYELGNGKELHLDFHSPLGGI